MRVQNKQRASCFCFWNKSPPFQEGDLPKCNPQPSEKCPFNLPKQWRYVSLFWNYHPVPEIIDPVFAKTSQNARFLLSEYERFGLVFTKTRVYKFGH
jgi:hypothetical protein